MQAGAGLACAWPAGELYEVGADVLLTSAMVMAIADSVTVSMGEDTMGVRSLIFFVTFVVMSTWE